MPDVSARVAIVIPARNAAATLPACLASIARQSFDDFRCTVVDDGSADGTRDLLRTWARADSRVDWLPNPGRGLVDALHAGLAASTGELVARMDADDVMHRDRLRLEVAALDADPGLCAVGCHVHAFPSAQVGPGWRDYVTWLGTIGDADAVARERFVECPLAHPTWLVRRYVLHAHGWRDGSFPEDYELLLRWFARGLRLGVVPRRLLAWRRSPGTATFRDPRYALARHQELKAEYLVAGILQQHAQFVLWGHGRTGRTLARALARHGRRPAAIIEIHPRRLGRRIGGAPVVPPEALADLGGLPVLVSVAGAANRALIRPQLLAAGWREALDFVCCA
jgi:cellulose synthase/poly-beta-1,6-N-acetylglucosamine synthase-like glycosyltransferase